MKCSCPAQPCQYAQFPVIPMYPPYAPPRYGIAYGAPPGTVTGRLSVPHQNPGGPSPAGAAVAAFAGAWLSSPVTRSSAMPVPSPARIRQESFLFVRDVGTPLHLLRIWAISL